MPGRNGRVEREIRDPGVSLSNELDGTKQGCNDRVEEGRAW